MAMDINTYVAMAGDYARSYLFYADIWCTVVKYFMDSTSSYLVSATSLPAQTIEAMETDWQGMKYKFGSTQSYEDFTMTFKCDSSQALRQAFVNWTENIHNPTTNKHGTPYLYMGKIGLTQLDTQGNAVMNYDLIGAWPNSVGEVTLDYSSKEIATFDVTFSYLYHISNGTLTSAAVGAAAALGAGYLAQGL